MDGALIVSRTEKSIAFFAEMLSAAAYSPVAVLRSCGEARRLFLERDFELVIINAPLEDESGEQLAREIASRGLAQVILAVPSEHFDATSAMCESEGVLTIAKPINRGVFWATLNLARSAQRRLRRALDENNRLHQKIEDIRVVDRAKYILITHLGMSEQEAHRHIEKRAMDARVSKRAVAEGILKTYEN